MGRGRVARVAVVAPMTKTGDMRVLDVLVLGPFMVWYASQAREVAPWARLALGLAGLGTMLVNARNYYETRGGR